jgi:hypothetical protein
MTLVKSSKKNKGEPGMSKRSFFPLFATLLMLAGMVLHVQARGTQSSGGSLQNGSTQHPQTATTTSDCFALSNEATGDFLSEMDTAGYGDFNLWQALVAIQGDTDPSVVGIITDQFLAALSSNPKSSGIFTTLLKTVDTPGNIVEVCTDGTVQTVPVYGYAFYDAGYPTLGSNISGVGRAFFTHSSDSNTYFVTWKSTSAGVTTTYQVFGVAWMGGLHRLYLPLVVK